MEKICYIYSLHDPDTGELRYIGETKMTPEERLQGHIQNPSSDVMREWISELKSKNQLPQQRIVEQCECYRRHHLEKNHIQTNASERLLNTTHNPFRDNTIPYETKLVLLERRIKQLENTDGGKYDELKKQYDELFWEHDTLVDKHIKLREKYQTLYNEWDKLKWLKNLYQVK